MENEAVEMTLSSTLSIHGFYDKRNRVIFFYLKYFLFHSDILLILSFFLIHLSFILRVEKALGAFIKPQSPGRAPDHLSARVSSANPRSAALPAT